MKKVIAAVQTEEEFDEALNSAVDIVFHLMPNILTLKKMLTRLMLSAKKCLYT